MNRPSCFFMQYGPECTAAVYQPPRNYRLSGKAIVTGRNRCCASDVTQVLGLGVGDLLAEILDFGFQLDVFTAELIYGVFEFAILLAEGDDLIIHCS